MKLPSYVEYIVSDVLSELDSVEVKRMFGGYSYYLDGAIFAFSGPDDGLMFKVDEATQPDFESRGSEQFVYEGHKNKGPVAMPYWTVPEEILEDKQLIADWALRSAAISRKNK